MNIWTLALLSCSEVSIGYLETENFSKMLSWHMKQLRVGLIMAPKLVKNGRIKVKFSFKVSLKISAAACESAD